MFHPEVFLQATGIKLSIFVHSAKFSLSLFTSKYFQATKVLVRGAAMFTGSLMSEEDVTHVMTVSNHSGVAPATGKEVYKRFCCLEYPWLASAAFTSSQYIEISLVSAHPEFLL